jgi:hypothetical protein
MSEQHAFPTEQDVEATWKDAAGRAEGNEGYRFGDITRISIRNASQKLEEWSSRPKRENGYEFGDLFLKDLVQSFTHSMEASLRSDDAEEESQEHKEIAASLVEKRQNATELLTKHLPRLEERLQELEAKREFDAQAKSEIFRIKYGGPACPRPLETYKKCLEDLRQSSEVPLNAAFVRTAESCGDLPMIQKMLDDTLSLSRACAQCADDLCPPLEDTRAQ